MWRRVPRSPTGLPRSHPSPEVGRSKPRRSLTAVVSPAPLGPRKPNTSPRGTVMVRPASATVRPKRLDSSTVLTAGVPAAALWGAAALVSSATSTGLRLNASGLLQVIRDVDRVGLLDRSGHGVYDALLDPDHRRADPGVVTERNALDALDGDGGRCCVLHRDRDGQRRVGIADGFDGGLELRCDAGLREQVALHLLDRDLGRRRGWGARD